MAYTFERPLPPRFGCYYLDDLEIDGRATWGLGQPAPDNDYTLGILVQDWADGYHKLSFTLRECTDMGDPLPRGGAPRTQYAARRLTFRVPADVVWWNTGWEVEPGSEVTLQCSGQWRVFAKKSLHLVGPKGLDRMTTPATLARSTQRCAVVAKTDRDLPFYVGWFARRELKGGGRLFVSQNGQPGEIPHSEGTMTVVVRGTLRQVGGGPSDPGAVLR
jgi:hypothetical protein